MAVEDFYESFSFTPSGQQTLLLAGTLEALDHDLGSRLASYEYLKRDGAEVESMGAAQARFAYRVLLMGSAPLTPGGPPMSAGARYLALAQAQRTQPRGLLNDPRLGRWNAAWSKIRTREEPQRAVDAIELTLEFIEDQTDAAISAEVPTPQARAGTLTDAYSTLAAASALRFGGSTSPLMRAVSTSSAALATVASAFATSALQVAQGLTVNPSLDSQLGAVERQVDVVLSALSASLAYSLEPGVRLTPYRHRAYMVLAYSRLLDEAVANQKPVLIEFTVPVAMSLDDVLLGLYGSDASNHFDEILSLNRIRDPLWIPQGTLLRAVAPQVRQ